MTLIPGTLLKEAVESQYFLADQAKLDYNTSGKMPLWKLRLLFQTITEKLEREKKEQEEIQKNAKQKKPSRK